MKNKIKTLVLLFVLSAMSFQTSYSQQANNLTEQEKKDGWQLLFNGKDLAGWHSYLKEKPTLNWTAKDESIMVIEKRNGHQSDLVTDKTYGNFDLKLEWKMEPCSNSGVMFYVNETPKYQSTYMTGPEMQITDFACLYTSDKSEVSDSRVTLSRAGALYGLIPSDTEWVKPAPQWNQYEIIADNGQLTFIVNGHKVVNTTMWDYNWWKLISRTKFQKWPDFGTYREGHISLQGTEDGKVWFRNIKIKPLRFGPST